MVAQQRRPYRSPSRARGAEQTRERVIAAAATLFTEQGYAATSMRGIAAAAGVSLERVTATGSKSELLLAAFRLSLEAGSTPMDSIVVEGVTDLREVLTPTARTIVVRIGRSLGIWRALTTAATVDDAVARARADLVMMRRAEMTALLWRLEAEGLTPTRTARQRRRIADAVGLIVSHEAYEQLVTLCGWTEDDYLGWAVETCGAALSGDPPE